MTPFLPRLSIATTAPLASLHLLRAGPPSLFPYFSCISVFPLHWTSHTFLTFSQYPLLSFLSPTSTLFPFFLFLIAFATVPLQSTLFLPFCWSFFSPRFCTEVLIGLFFPFLCCNLKRWTFLYRSSLPPGVIFLPRCRCQVLQSTTFSPLNFGLCPLLFFFGIPSSPWSGWCAHDFNCLPLSSLIFFPSP